MSSTRFDPQLLILSALHRAVANTAEGPFQSDRLRAALDGLARSTKGEPRNSVRRTRIAAEVALIEDWLPAEQAELQAAE